MNAMNALQASRQRPRVDKWRSGARTPETGRGICGAAFARDVRKCLQASGGELQLSFPVRFPQTIREARRLLADDLHEVMRQVTLPKSWQGQCGPTLETVTVLLNTADAEVCRLGGVTDPASLLGKVLGGKAPSVREQFDRIGHLTRTAKALFDELVCMQTATHGLRRALQCRSLDWRGAPDECLTPAGSSVWIERHAATDGVNMSRQAMLIAYAAGQRCKDERLSASLDRIADAHRQLAAICEQSANAMELIRDDARRREWQMRVGVDL